MGAQQSMAWGPAGATVTTWEVCYADGARRHVLAASAGEAARKAGGRVVDVREATLSLFHGGT